MPKLGPYSKEIVLARPDGRTKEARCLQPARKALLEHLGREARLSAPQRALVERAAMLQLRCAVLDGKILDGTFSVYGGHGGASHGRGTGRGSFSSLSVYPRTC